MAVYAIGDVQGCADQLEALLLRLDFDAHLDRLWFVGDLVNRGPRSLDTLRLVRSLGAAAIVVLGNHDLHLLAIARGGAPWKSTDGGLEQVMAAPDREALLDWLQAQPLMHHDPRLQASLLHAGLPPQWDVATALGCAREVERGLQGERVGELFAHMYGNEPSLWHDELASWVAATMCRMTAASRTSRAPQSAAALEWSSWAYRLMRSGPLKTSRLAST